MGRWPKGLEHGLRTGSPNTTWSLGHRTPSTARHGPETEKTEQTVASGGAILVAGLAPCPGSCPQAWMRTHSSTVTVAVLSGWRAGGTWDPPLSSGDAHCGMNTPRKMEMKQLKGRLSEKKNSAIGRTMPQPESQSRTIRFTRCIQRQRDRVADEERPCDRGQSCAQTTGLRPSPNRLSAACAQVLAAEGSGRG